MKRNKTYTEIAFDKTFRIPTCHSLSSLDDHTLFYFIIKKQ